MSALTLSAGDVTSTGGTISLLAGGQLSGTGKLDVSGSTWVLGGDFVKSSGTLTISQTNLELEEDITFSSDEAIRFLTLSLNYHTLTLGSSTSDLTVDNALNIGQNTEGISTGDADLILNQYLRIFEEGSITSTGGTISLQEGGELSGTETGNGILDISDSIWTLGGDFTKSSGTLTISETTDLALSGSSTLTSDVSLSFENLNLNNFTLTLGSSTSDLTVEKAITIDSSGEGISTGEADLILMSALTLSEGLLQSSGGTWEFNGDFKKTGGTLSITETDLTLTNNITLTSDVALSFVTLNFNYFKLTLGSATSDLTIQNAITIDAITEGIFTGKADLILNRALTMSNGRLESTGGTIKLAHGQIQTSKFSGDARMMLDNTTLTSDDGSLIAFIEIDGEPDLSMTDSSHISYITLTTTANTVGSISTTVGVDCLDNCTGFIETGAYGFNTHGLYRKVTSANWMLSESIGERKTATLAVKLLSRPLSDVEVILSSSDLSEATLSGNTLTDSGYNKFLSFTPSTWNRVQEVTITGEDDDLSDYDVRVRILGYTDSVDANYASTSAVKTHAFKYTFTNINDDLQKGVSPIVQIGADQKVNEKTRVILDGSASYDPDPTGRIVAFKWKYIGQRTDVTLTRESESIAYFDNVSVGETTVMLFGLEVIDDDKTASYGSTSITIVPVKEITAVGSAVGSIKPKYPENITLDSEETAVMVRKISN